MQMLPQQISSVQTRTVHSPFTDSLSRFNAPMNTHWMPSAQQQQQGRFAHQQGSFAPGYASGQPPPVGHQSQAHNMPVVPGVQASYHRASSAPAPQRPQMSAMNDGPFTTEPLESCKLEAQAARAAVAAQQGFQSPQAGPSQEYATLQGQPTFTQLLTPQELAVLSHSLKDLPPRTQREFLFQTEALCRQHVFVLVRNNLELLRWYVFYTHLLATSSEPKHAVVGGPYKRRQRQQAIFPRPTIRTRYPRTLRNLLLCGKARPLKPLRGCRSNTPATRSGRASPPPRRPSTRSTCSR